MGCSFSEIIIHCALIRSFLGVILLIFAESEEDLCPSDMFLWWMIPNLPD